MTDNTTQPREQARNLDHERELFTACLVKTNDCQAGSTSWEPDGHFKNADVHEKFEIWLEARASTVAAPEAPTDIAELATLLEKLHARWGDCLWIDAGELMALEKVITNHAATTAPSRNAAAICDEVAKDCIGEREKSIARECARRIRAALTQQSAAQAPVEYQGRMRPMWRAEGEGWTEWTKCSEGVYDDYTKTPINGDWQFEARALYLAAQASHAGADTERDAARYHFKLQEKYGEYVKECRLRGIKPASYYGFKTVAEQEIDAAMSAATEQGEKP